MKEKQTKVKVEFSCFGENFDVVLFAKRIGLKATNMWTKGDTSEISNSGRKESSWAISTEYENSLDVNNQLLPILKKIEPKKETFLLLKDKYTFEIKLEIVIQIENNQSPALCLDPSILKTIAYLKLTLDIDLYNMD